MAKTHWWKVILLVLVVGVLGVVYIGVKTYQDAPPITDFVDQSGNVVMSRANILDGQIVFQKYSLMNFGSMFGDGAGRGPDFTADALHLTAQFMKEYYTRTASQPSADEYQYAAIDARVKKEIKLNQHDAAKNVIAVTEGQAYAFQEMKKHYRKFFGEENASMGNSIRINSESEIDELASFFAWGAWVCGVSRPGETYSYTHNWPYDPTAGNEPTSAVMMWSVMGVFGLILGLGYTLFVRGKLNFRMEREPDDRTKPFATLQAVSSFTPSPTQRATYKFFAVAAALFVLQVVAGLFTIHDFVQYTGIDISAALPITISRSWHLQLALFWISTCWIAASIFCLPLMSGKEPKGQLGYVNLLFAMLVVLVLGTVLGVFMGPKGMLGEWWRWFGNQGWEFVELGKIWQILLFIALGMWAFIVWRGLMPFLKSKDKWALPNWISYTIACVFLLFISGFVAQPTTNFAIADFWRWCVIHMWVEAFLEVFTTVVVAYHLYLMGLVSWNSATRTVFLATVLFLGSGMLGIAHNFYWNAKPVPTLAIGSVFSTLQVVPLILLSLEAWRYRNMPQTAYQQSGGSGSARTIFGQSSAFLFLIGVSFWNFMGAGVFGLIINLPIVNYFEHGTYLTVNHGHAAFMGVYGNLSLAAMVFCARFLVPAERWNEKVMRTSFWSINLGLALMVVLDLFPAGIMQLQAVFDRGLWFARSDAFLLGDGFQMLTYLRGIGTALFIGGGVLPLAWFMITRGKKLKLSGAGVFEGELSPDSARA